MAPSEQMTEQGLQKLLEDAALAGQWILDPSRSIVSLKNRSMGGLATVKGVFRQGTVSQAGQVNGALTIAAAVHRHQELQARPRPFRGSAVAD